MLSSICQEVSNVDLANETVRPEDAVFGVSHEIELKRQRVYSPRLIICFIQIFESRCLDTLT